MDPFLAITKQVHVVNVLQGSIKQAKALNGKLAFIYTTWNDEHNDLTRNVNLISSRFPKHRALFSPSFNLAP